MWKGFNQLVGQSFTGNNQLINEGRKLMDGLAVILYETLTDLKQNQIK